MPTLLPFISLPWLKLVGFDLQNAAINVKFVTFTVLLNIILLCLVITETCTNFSFENLASASEGLTALLQVCG